MTDPKHEAYAPHPLSGIVEDLWGWSRPQTEPDAAFPAPKAAPAFPPFDQLWQVADETVDWTEALALLVEKPRSPFFAATCIIIRKTRPGVKQNL